MTYSLVNIAAVARDVARRSAGDRLALDLLHVLSLDAAALDELDATVAPASRHCREVVHAAATAEPRALELLAATREAARTAGLGAWTSSLQALEAAPIGGADALVAWVRDELLAAAWERAGDVAVLHRDRAVTAVTDGLLASWVDVTADGWLAAPTDELAAPWRRWTRGRRPATVSDSGAAAVVTAIAAADRAALTAAGADLRAAKASGWSWASSMHDACWAIELTGRGRSAAVAQLTAVRAALAVTGAPLPRADIVAAVTAAVHGTLAADLLPAATVAALCRPLLAHV